MTSVGFLYNMTRNPAKSALSGSVNQSHFLWFIKLLVRPLSKVLATGTVIAIITAELAQTSVAVFD